MEDCTKSAKRDVRELRLADPSKSPAESLAAKTEGGGKTLGKMEKIEDDIRRTKLKEIVRMKEELQQKLLSLSENAELLQKSVSASFPQSVKKDKDYYKLSKEDRRKLKEEFEAKRQEAMEFVKKKQTEKKERHKREKAILRQEEDKKRASEEARAKEAKVREVELLASRREDALKNMQELKQRREEETKKRQEQEEKHQPQEVYLYQKYEERYKKMVELPLLEARKQFLAEKRNVLKPISNKELDERAQKYEEIMTAREDERREEIRKKREIEDELAEKQKQFRTTISEKIHERDAKQKEELEKRNDVRKTLKLKMDSYANSLKETCPVVPSDCKANELKQLVEHLKQPTRQPRDVRKLYVPSALHTKKGRRSSSTAEREGKAESKSMDKRAADEKSRQPKSGESKSVARGGKIKLEEAVSKEMMEAAKKKREQQMDYLTSIRLQREAKYGASKPDKFNWQADIKSERIGDREKRERVERKARMIEEQAKKKEQLYYQSGGPDKNVEMGQYVSDMFIDAIKAKLAILDHM